MNGENIKVLLVDDHPFAIEGLRSYLLAQGGVEVVGMAANGKEAIDKTLALHPAVLIMDLTMPVMDGLEATRRLRACAPEAKVLMLTAHQTPEFTSSIIQAGVWGLVSKSAPPSELSRGIEALCRGETFFRPEVRDAFLKTLANPTGQRQQRMPNQLSPREREVVKLVGDGLLNKEIAGVLGLSVRTVEKHRERIMRKLNVRSIAELTKFAIANEIVRLD